MNKEDLMVKVNEIFKDIFEDDEIEVTTSTTADDIDEWDSLTHLQLIATIESEFEIKFKLGEITGFKNVGELCDSILKHIG